ncbi:MAG: hypothetical protein OGM11_07510 [Clostridiaceae bacterium]|nr:MAG: hypothetical protein OGM11_07510 [Clostridiaceae bacterium]
MEKVNNLIHSLFNPHTFLREVPSSLSRVLTPDDVGGKTWKKLTARAEEVRNRLRSHKKVKVDAWTLRDKGAAYLEMLPCPLGVVQVLTNDAIVRYAVVMFYQEEHILLSVQKLKAGDTVSVTGLNLDSGAADLVNLTWRLCQSELAQRTIVIDRKSTIAAVLKERSSQAMLIEPGVTAEDIRRLPPVGIFVLVHCVETALTPLMKREARGFYYPEIVLSDKEDVAVMQRAELRHLLAEWSFVRGCGNLSGLAAEVVIQSEADIRLLQSIKGLPVLARSDSDPQQKKLTTLMQTAQIDLVEADRSPGVLQTVPLLIGTALPADNVALTMEWNTFEHIDRTAVHFLSQVLTEKFGRLDAAVARLEQELLPLRLSEHTYPAAHFLAASRAVDHILFDETEWRGTLVEQAEKLVETIDASEDNRLRRYADAATLLQERQQLEPYVAESADDMTEQHLGFLYLDKDGNQWLAFSLDDFAALIEKFGLLAADSLPFRKYLTELGFMTSASGKARGRDKKSSTHVLLHAEKCGYGCGIPQNSSAREGILPHKTL